MKFSLSVSIVVFVILAVSLLSAACSPAELFGIQATARPIDTITPVPTEPPPPTDTPEIIPTAIPIAVATRQSTIRFEDVCTQPDTSEVTVIGYLYLPEDFSLQSGYYKIELGRTSGYPIMNQEHLDLFIKVGIGLNEMQSIVGDYTMTDFKITTYDGKIVGQKAAVKITGRVQLAGGWCSLWAIKVVKI